MLTIRLQRVGRKNQAFFRIVVAEKHRAASKKSVEQLGFYDPRKKNFGIKDPERLKYWIAQHVEISPTMHNLLVSKNLLEGKKIQAWRPKRKPAEEAGKKVEEAKSAAPTSEAVGAPTSAQPSVEEAPKEAPAGESSKSQEPNPK